MFLSILFCPPSFFLIFKFLSQFSHSKLAFVGMCRYSSVCGLGRDVPLLSPASGVINGPHTYQTNMDPTVTMGTASAAPQKGGRGRKRRSGMWSEKQERGGGGGAAAAAAVVGRVTNGERGNREGGMEGKRRREKPTSISLKYLIQQKGWPWWGRQRQLGFPTLCFYYHFSLPHPPFIAP